MKPMVWELDVLLEGFCHVFTQVQCQLDKEGASSLVIDLVIKNSSNRVFLESVELGIALLEGGNTNIQVCTYMHVCYGLLRHGKMHM